MEYLDLNIKNEEKNIILEEVMNVSGNWNKAKTFVKKKLCKKLKYCSILHDYYIYQNNQGEHTLFRNKKNDLL